MASQHSGVRLRFDEVKVDEKCAGVPDVGNVIKASNLSGTVNAVPYPGGRAICVPQDMEVVIVNLGK